MEKVDEILLEQIISYNHMTIDDRNLFINLLLHTKDISDSEKSIGNNKSTKYDILFINLRKYDGSKCAFEGTVSGEYENRWINGIIFKEKDKYKVTTNVYRLNDCLDEDEKEYVVFDTFEFNYGYDPDKAFRTSRYMNEEVTYTSEVELFMDLELDDYLEKKVRKLRRID